MVSISSPCSLLRIRPTRKPKTLIEAKNNRPTTISASNNINNSSQQEEEEEEEDLGVKVALSMLRFYKREISPLMASSCRFVPTCSEYSMQAYKKYGVAKGTVLTAWRLCRCNPLGGSGFDPPRWFGDDNHPTQQ